MIRSGVDKNSLPREAITLFIRKTKGTNELEKCWIGKVRNFRNELKNDVPAIRFDVLEIKEINCPPEFKSYSNGWYTRKPTSIETHYSSQNSNLNPTFFNEMSRCNFLDFELHCFHLLRLLGIHDIHKFPQDDNRGKADGFFRFHTLSVIYDATLEAEFLPKKQIQIENYISQLKKEKIVIDSGGKNIGITIQETRKEVWIITRGNNVRQLKTVDHIKVKEIPCTRLISLYNRRLVEEIGTDEFCEALRDL
jgi:hypothetical protein